jgi:hypothetical protein
MNDRQLKLYAIKGILISIEDEKKKISKIQDFETSRLIIERIKKMEKDYNELLRDLR